MNKLLLLFKSHSGTKERVGYLTVTSGRDAVVNSMTGARNLHRAGFTLILAVCGILRFKISIYLREREGGGLSLIHI